MAAIASGNARKDYDISKEKAREFISHNKGSMSYKDLPEKKKKKKV